MKIEVKKNIMILTVLIFGVIMMYISITSEIERNHENDLKAVKEYDKCLKENFNQRYDCARDIEGYTYRELDQLRIKYLKAK